MTEDALKSFSGKGHFGRAELGMAFGDFNWVQLTLEQYSFELVQVHLSGDYFSINTYYSTSQSEAG